VKQHVLRTAGLICVLLLVSLPSYAEEPKQNDIYTIPKLVAVQNRNYNVNQNLSVLLGYLPTDAFTKGVTAGAAYTYYFSDFTAWEILNANYVFNIDTGLKRDLVTYFSAQPDNQRVLDFPEYYGTTNLMYTPLYNKNLLFNKSIVYGENSFVIGAGMAKFRIAGFLPLVGGGIIFKYFVSKSSSLKLDIREWVYNDSERGTNTILDLKLGFDILLGDTPRDTQ
jgi:outer membrane beta-barrel protein